MDIYVYEYIHVGGKYFKLFYLKGNKTELTNICKYR